MSCSKCPKCDYLFVLRAGFVGTPVSCPECNHIFCQLCNEVLHKGKSCEEAKAEKETLDAHASTADAMTEAVVRTCPNPKCKKRFFKEDGCNKMTCPGCKQLSCYICRQAIKDYSHFCLTPHCNHESCSMCVLFTDAKEDDRRARREVAQKALVAAQKKEGAAAAATLISGLLSPTRKENENENARGPLQPVQQPNAIVQQQRVEPQRVQEARRPERGNTNGPQPVQNVIRPVAEHQRRNEPVQPQPYEPPRDQEAQRLGRDNMNVPQQVQDAIRRVVEHQRQNKPAQQPNRVIAAQEAARPFQVQEPAADQPAIAEPLQFIGIPHNPL